LRSISIEKICTSADMVLNLRKWRQDLGAGGFFDSIVIASIALAKRPNIYFEIGTGDGRSSLLVSANTPDSTRLVTLEPFYPKDPVKGSVFRGEPEAQKIQQLSGYSNRFDFSPWHNKVDLVFVDGGHEFEDVVNDTAVAFRLISPGGWILWHDVAADFPAVVTALEQSDRSDLIRLIGGTRYAIYQSDTSMS
jgi:predicted O-methyltransferase YrrM